jgi:hypothetical protein
VINGALIKPERSLNFWRLRGSAPQFGALALDQRPDRGNPITKMSFLQ